MSGLAARVGIVQVQDIDDDAHVRTKMYELLDLLQDRIRIPADARVVIKVNLCLLLDCETGATIDPRLVRYLAEWLLERRSIREIVFAESDATALSADRAFYGLGWDHMLAESSQNTLSEPELVMRRVKVNLDGLFLKEVEMSRTFMEADYVISFAKLKTHSMQVISGIMKNQFGALPEKLKVVYHPHLAEVICDVVRIRPPDLCLVDGLIAHEGPGPVSGIPRSDAIDHWRNGCRGDRSCLCPADGYEPAPGSPSQARRQNTTWGQISTKSLAAESKMSPRILILFPSGVRHGGG